MILPKLKKHKGLIDSTQVPKPIKRIVRKLKNNGYDAKLVGGCVRDILLGLNPKDFDVVTSATPNQVKHLFSHAQIIGRRFRIVHVKCEIGVVEVSTYRKVSKNPRDPTVPTRSLVRSPKQVGTMKHDYLLRDFTVNALYFDIERNVIYDFVHGLKDLKHRQLRCIGDPVTRFNEDCHRILRAVRFVSKLGFQLTENLEQSLHAQTHLLERLEPHRLSYDLEKMLLHGYARALCSNLVKYKFLPYIFPSSDTNDPLSQAALKNTDDRVKIGKPVRFSFLLAAFYWHHYREMNVRNDREAEILAAKKILEYPAEQIALRADVRDFVVETWRLQAKLEQRPLRNGKQLLGRKRFRAGYDLLCMRANLGEASQEIANWWTKIQEVPEAEQERMLKEVAPARKRRSKRRRRPQKASQQVATAP